MDVRALYDAVAAVCPVQGVRPGDPDDRSTWAVDFDPSATDGQREAALRIVATWTPSPAPRRATLAALFDPLSAAQRASITADHLMRLQADAAAVPDGTVYVGSSKVLRAAGDLGMAPDAWFKMAGV